jgi:hypothetical protein
MTCYKGTLAILDATSNTREGYTGGGIGVGRFERIFFILAFKETVA